jgi:IstB-like ATP binding protein
MNDSTRDTIKVDAARLPLLLRELRLPTIAAMWQGFTERADREGWPAARLLATLTELELAERDQQRIQRHLLEARLPPGKTLDRFDFTAVPMLSRAHVAALATSHPGTLACRQPNAGRAMDGSTEAARSCCPARAGRASRISAPPSVTRLSRTASGCC